MECISGDFSHKKPKSLGKFLDKYFLYTEKNCKAKGGLYFLKFHIYKCFLLQKAIVNCKSISIILYFILSRPQYPF